MLKYNNIYEIEKFSQWLGLLCAEQLGFILSRYRIWIFTTTSRLTLSLITLLSIFYLRQTPRVKWWQPEIDHLLPFNTEVQIHETLPLHYLYGSKALPLVLLLFYAIFACIIRLFLLGERKSALYSLYKFVWKPQVLRAVLRAVPILSYNCARIAQSA
jgi:hypothetical protein